MLISPVVHQLQPTTSSTDKWARMIGKRASPQISKLFWLETNWLTSSRTRSLSTLRTCKVSVLMETWTSTPITTQVKFQVFLPAMPMTNWPLPGKHLSTWVVNLFKNMFTWLKGMTATVKVVILPNFPLSLKTSRVEYSTASKSQLGITKICNLLMLSTSGLTLWLLMLQFT